MVNTSSLRAKVILKLISVDYVSARHISHLTHSLNSSLVVESDTTRIFTPPHLNNKQTYSDSLTSLPTIHKHLATDHPRHTSLCQSKTSKPSVSNHFAQPLTHTTRFFIRPSHIMLLPPKYRPDDDRRTPLIVIVKQTCSQ